MTSNPSAMITVSDARARILAAAAPLGTEAIAIADAGGRVLAEPVRARLMQPPFAASAMDGYAVRFDDVSVLPARLKVIGEAPAGTIFTGALARGQAVRIFTGGAMPEGADTVVIQEDTERAGETVIVKEPQKKHANVRAAGIDFQEGETLVKAGTAIDGPALALAAAGNVAQIAVYRRPRVALLSTGDELVPPGSTLGPGKIVNSIGPGLAALLEEWGADVIHVGHAIDAKGAIAVEWEHLTAADVAVVIGGASVGEYDLVKATFRSLGLETIFEKVAVKPGKPVWAGHFKDTRFVGLPGNPASAFVCAWLFLKPLIWALTGRDGNAAVRVLSARLKHGLSGNGGREAYLRARTRLEDGGLVVETDSRQDSSLLSPFADVDCLVMRPADAPAVEAGAPVPILPIRPLFGS